MDWSTPTHLFALLAVPAVVAFFAWAAARRREALRRFAGEQDTYAESLARRRRWQAALLTGAVLFVALALGGPRYGTQLREVRQDGLDVIIALDVSESMRAEDVAPSRLARAKYEITQLLDALEGSRVGLVVFAGEAFLQCPLTTDFGAVRLFLDAAAPSLVPTQGTDLGQALRVSLQSFDVADGGLDGDEQRARALLILSDGENHAGGFGPDLAAASDLGVTVFAAGVGETDGTQIPIYRRGRLAGYKTDRNGQTVETRLEETALREIAEGGSYYRIGRGASDVLEITDALGRLDRGTFAAEQFETFAEQYQWPLGLALLLLVAERLLAARREPDPVAV